MVAAQPLRRHAIYVRLTLRQHPNLNLTIIAHTHTCVSYCGAARDAL